MKDTPDPRGEDELRETLDLLATVMASLSDRVDAQGDALDKLARVSAETRQAAFQARAQSDMGPVAEALSKTIAGALQPLQAEMRHVGQSARQERETTVRRIEALLEERSAPDNQRTRFLQGAVPRNWTPFFAALLLVLAVGSGFALPRAVASANWTLGCWLMGGDTINGMTVCLPQETAEEEDTTAS